MEHQKKLTANQWKIAGAATLVPASLVVGRSAIDLTIMRDAVDALTASDKAVDAVSRPRLAPLAGELWLAIVRLTRIWRERVRTAELRLAAAEADWDVLLPEEAGDRLPADALQPEPGYETIATDLVLMPDLFPRRGHRKGCLPRRPPERRPR